MTAPPSSRMSGGIFGAACFRVSALLLLRDCRAIIPKEFAEVIRDLPGHHVDRRSFGLRLRGLARSQPQARCHRATKGVARCGKRTDAPSVTARARAPRHFPRFARGEKRMVGFLQSFPAPPRGEGGARLLSAAGGGCRAAPYPFSRISLPCSRFQSRSAMTWRLSGADLPLARASSSLARPLSLK